jgi:hypothetical protein
VRTSRLRTALWFLLATWAQTATSVAQPTASALPPQSTQARRAQAYVDLATTFFQEGNFGEALDELRNAEPLLDGDPSQAAVRFNIARCLEEMRRPAEALNAYGVYLESGEQGPRRARAEAAMAKLKAEHFGRLEVTCVPADALVTLEGGPDDVRMQRRCPIADQLSKGNYVATVRAEGHLERRIELAVTPGQARIERIELAVAAPPAVAVQSPKQPEPPQPPPQPATSVVAPAALAPAPVAEGRGPWPWVTIGAGGLAIVGGSVLHAMMAGARDDAADTAPGSADRAEKTEAFEALRLGALVGYGLGAVATAVGVWLLLDAPEAGTTARIVGAPGGLEVRF